MTINKRHMMSENILAMGHFAGKPLAVIDVAADALTEAEILMIHRALKKIARHCETVSYSEKYADDINQDLAKLQQQMDRMLRIDD